ncbi:uncharacterized protein [Rutidosis leptorrhynchoides]|uniref:uncharacterized protein n=1 Tax=Rutidosis leptorrhynchoides TaxID=125765 RepID=UPI003A9A0D12
MNKINTFMFNLVITLTSLNFYCTSTSQDGVSLRTDQLALEEIKAQITTDPFGIISKNWTSNTSICTWRGVSCSLPFQTRRVTVLDLSNMGLVGTISPHIGNLSVLTSLDFTNNSFHGSIPPEIMQMRHLEELYLGNNDLTGDLPLSYSKSLPKLEILFLDYNNLTGTLSSVFLDRMPSLKTLSLRYNSFYGNIPDEIGNRSRLRFLSLNNNQFTGLVPQTLFNLSYLTRADLSFNSLSGTLPDDMCNQLAYLIQLYISGNKLTGSIPSLIEKCQQLRYLSISLNEFNGVIPRGIWNLTLLEELYLGYNNLQEGLIPADIQNLKRLTTLSIPDGNLVGHVPQVVFNISSLRVLNLRKNLFSKLPISNYNINLLEELDLSYNQFTGQLPSGFWKLKGLRRIDLSNNHFTGSISSDVMNLTLLTHIYLQSNRLTGIIPNEINYLPSLDTLGLQDNDLEGNIRFNISTLKVLDLSVNSFSSILPAEFGFWLPNLERLYLRNNLFRGTLPSSIVNASKLYEIEISTNSFSGSIPITIGRLELLERLLFGQNNFTVEGSELIFLSSLTNCRKLRTLAFAQNPLMNANLPSSIGNLSTSLELFQAFESGIKGNIPSGIGNLTNLRTLALDTNELVGNIPTELGKLQNLGQLYLESNRIKGKVPQEFCLLRNLGELYLSDNRLSGIIPTCIGDIGSLSWLFLDSNSFTDTIPSTIWSHKSLVALNLSSNFLIGNLPSSIGSSNPLLTVLDLSSNKISGAIPSSIGGYQMLKKLSLARNYLQGTIPESLGMLISLELLDLSQNNLSGVIPTSLEALRYLESFNVSYNRLQGEIPNGGKFSNFTAFSFTHNKDLCGAPKYKVLSCRRKHHKSKALSSLKYVLPIVIVLSVIGFVIAVYLLRRHKKRIQTNVDPSTGYNWKRVSYYEIVRATNSFDESNLIGKGAYGSVYEGKLSDGVNIAVKVFNLFSERAVKSFDSECEVLRNIRHRNLVSIISSCTNMDFRCLVLKYIPNGSLEQWLYSHNYFLSLMQRLQIMIDVASAIEYLHHGNATPIIHCDLKPSNVLLDEDMKGYVCDFGIAKIVGDEELMLRTTTLGTVGYMAPEYGMEGIVSTGCDVYSFGILLLETFTRKKPTDEMFCGELRLRSWVLEATQRSIFEVVDTNLISGNISTKEEESLASIFNLAMDCTSDLSSRRINMEETVVRLSKIYKNVLQNN